MIDFHAHTPAHGPASEGDARAPYHPSDFLAFMDEAGIDRAVMLNYQGLLDGSTEANDFVAEFVAHDPRRLIGFGTVNARLAGAVAEVHRMMGDLGLKGMKLHPWVQGISVMEPAMDRVCEALVEHNGILLSHDGTPPYAMATQLASLARRHPDLPIVLGHSGLLDFWREAVVAATETENIYLCVASVNPFAGRMVVERAPRDKVLFGTDAGLAPDGRQNYALARVRELAGWGISDDDIERITVTNPTRLLAGRA
jgi:predicted TIM-barrel fold metal-dependent hydrolase